MRWNQCAYIRSYVYGCVRRYVCAKVRSFCFRSQWHVGRAGWRAHKPSTDCVHIQYVYVRCCDCTKHIASTQNSVSQSRVGRCSWTNKKKKKMIVCSECIFMFNENGNKKKRKITLNDGAKQFICNIMSQIFEYYFIDDTLAVNCPAAYSYFRRWIYAPLFMWPMRQRNEFSSEYEIGTHKLSTVWRWPVIT